MRLVPLDTRVVSMSLSSGASKGAGRAGGVDQSRSFSQLLSPVVWSYFVSAAAFGVLYFYSRPRIRLVRVAECSKVED